MLYSCAQTKESWHPALPRKRSISRSSSKYGCCGLHGRRVLTLLGIVMKPEADRGKSWALRVEWDRQEGWAWRLPPFPGSQDGLIDSRLTNIPHTSSPRSDKSVHPPGSRYPLGSLTQRCFLVGQLSSLPLGHGHSHQP